MTFSLAGRCKTTGMLGAVVTTSSMAVGSRCSYAAAGIGAALTQHRTDPRLGPLALELLSRGFTADEAMKAIVAATSHRDWRQLAFIDASGGTASYSGASVRAERGEAHGHDCVAIANIVRSAGVPGAMVRAFEAGSEAPLATRLIAALAAGESEGGEFQPVTSAALLVAHRETFPYVDLRVDDHKSPIAELARLWAAYAPEAEAYVVRAIDPENATRPAAMIAANF
jgi:uncharacterized Ntn-hydrolase superfamily protein